MVNLVNLIHFTVTSRNSSNKGVNPKLETVLNKHQTFLKKQLPFIKAQRNHKAAEWRKKKHRSNGMMLSHANYYSTKDLNILKEYSNSFKNHN